MPDQDKLNLSFVENKQLELICFAAYSVYLHFDGKVLITVEGPFRHDLPGDARGAPNTEFPLSSSDLVSLVTHSIEEISRDPDGTLRLKFSNGHTLTIGGASGPYQGYEITVHGVPVANSSTSDGGRKTTE